MATSHMDGLHQHTIAASKGAHLVKPNYAFEKRQRDLAKKQKQEEKRRQKLADKAAAEGGARAPAEDTSEAPLSGTESGAAIRTDDADTPE